MLQLYSADISPFAARVRIAMYHKHLSFEDLGMPPAGLKSAEFLGVNPMGKIPVLILADGAAIVESETILDYLDDAYPERPLRPSSPIDRARVRTVIRVTDNYVTPPTVRLYPHLDPGSRVDAAVAAEIRHMREGLAHLEHFVADAPHAVGSHLTLADCCVFPSLFLCDIIARQLSVPDIFKDTPRLTGYFHKAQTQPELARVHREMSAALQA